MLSDLSRFSNPKTSKVLIFIFLFFLFVATTDQETFGDDKEVIRSHNDQKEKYKRTSKCGQNITQKTND